MSLYVNTNLHPTVIPNGMSLADNHKVSQRWNSSPSLKSKTFGPLSVLTATNTNVCATANFVLRDRSVSSARLKPVKRRSSAVHEPARGRSISLFAPRHHLATNLEAPCSTAAADTGSVALSLRCTHPMNNSTEPGPLTTPTSCSFDSFSFLFKGHTILETGRPTQPHSCLPENSQTIMSNSNDCTAKLMHLNTARATAFPHFPAVSKIRMFRDKRPPYISPCLSYTSSSTSDQASSLPSPIARARRSPPSESGPVMAIQSSEANHTLSVNLPRIIQPEMVTIAAKKGDRLAVVADAWHMENDCHYEWHIHFSPGDVYMSSIRAKFNGEGRLTIEVQRQR